MSRLYGFKFEYTERGSDGYFRVLTIESTLDNKIYLLIKDSSFMDYLRVDITNNIASICNKLAELDINSWAHEEFIYPMSWFPGFYWKLAISTDEINIACRGSDNFPENWIDFVEGMESVGIPIFKKHNRKKNKKKGDVSF